MTIQRLLRIGLNVGDLDLTQEFYVEALGFEAVAEGADATLADMLGVVRLRTRTLQLGTQVVELAACDPPGAPYPAESMSCDLWFQHFAIVVPDIGKAYDQLRSFGHTPITHGGPQHLPAASGGATAYKFRDPDGHPLELIHFPERALDMAGINHSAISVSDVARSIAFYTGLGLSVGSRQTNTGPEQDRLDGLDDVSVAVIPLHPAQQAEPHIELLGYGNPRGRSTITAATDIAATRLVMASDSALGLMTDPDGHRLLLLPE